MDKTILTPEESLLLITKTIQDTKKKFKDSGDIYIFWGFLILFVSLSQYIILRLESNKIIDLDYTINAFPCLLYPLGGIYTYVFYRRKFRKQEMPRTMIGYILGALGPLLGANFMVLGFLFWEQLGAALIPVFLILLAIWTIISGVSIKFKPLYIGGILINLLGFWLNKDQKEENV